MKTEVYQKITIRLTPSLYEDIKKRAVEQRRSLGGEIVSLVERVLPDEPPALTRQHSTNAKIYLI